MQKSLVISLQTTRLTELLLSSFKDKVAQQLRSSASSARQLPRQQLDRRDLQQDNFSDSSLAEESFRQATSPTAAWKKRPSQRQLQRQQLGRRDLPHSSFKESSLKGTFAFAAWKTTAWQLSLEQASFQRRTSTTELSELERTALHTELAELQRPALTTELAQLQTNSFDESSFELSLKSPASQCNFALARQAPSSATAAWRLAAAEGEC